LVSPPHRHLRYSGASTMNWKAANWVSPGFESAGETVKKPALHVAITRYLEQIDALKKPNTHRKYEAVLNRFAESFRDCVSIDAISGDDLTRFVVTLKKDICLGSNTILHNEVIFTQI